MTTGDILQVRKPVIWNILCSSLQHNILEIIFCDTPICVTYSFIDFFNFEVLP